MNTTELEKFRKELSRKASRMIVGGFRPPENPLASWFGRIQVGLEHEQWPFTSNGPMFPLCQINCTELPYRPENLKDIAFITVFMDNSNLPIDPPNENRDGWLLRTYADLASLVALEAPNLPRRIKSFPVRWELIEEDFPYWQDLPKGHPFLLGITAQDDTWLKKLQDYQEQFPNQMISKVGGWPSVIQSPPFSAGDIEYIFQIDSEDKAEWQWGDAGMGWFGRDEHDEWWLDWSCY